MGKKKSEALLEPLSEPLSEGREALFRHIGYEPHNGQRRIHSLVDSHRFTTVVAGRRTGKSFSAAAESAYQLLQAGDKFGTPTVYLVSDTHAHTTKVFHQVSAKLQRHFPKLIEQVYQKDRIINLTNGAQLFSRSAENPASLAGDGVSFAVIDEASFVDNYAVEVLMPSLLERKGKVLAIGTPDRHNWFKDWFDLGLIGEDYASLQLATSSNPHIDPAEIEKERKRRSTEFFARYYLAEWVDAAETPLAALISSAVVHKEPAPPDQYRRYVAGVDLADRIDFTAVVVVDITQKPFRVVDVQRWQGVGYEATGKRIAEVLRSYNAQGYVDRTGVGDAAIRYITQHYGNVVPVVFTLREKMGMFDTVAAHLERQELELLDANHLVEELRILRATEVSKGVSYAAPDGAHDDVAMALFLASKGFQDFSIWDNIRHPSLSGFRLPI